MALPIDRCFEITSNASKILESNIIEIAMGASPKRVHEMDRDAKLIRIILKAIWIPYKAELHDLLDEDTLETFLNQLGL